MEVQVLLMGEDPKSQHVDDASHWIAVYAELLKFAEGHAPPVKVDLYQRRLEFWRKRELHLTAELAGPIGAPS